MDKRVTKIDGWWYGQIKDNDHWTSVTSNFRTSEGARVALNRWVNENKSSFEVKSTSYFR